MQLSVHDAAFFRVNRPHVPTSIFTHQRECVHHAELLPIGRRRASARRRGGEQRVAGAIKKSDKHGHAEQPHTSIISAFC
jgi:hypothetical protein